MVSWAYEETGKFYGLCLSRGEFNDNIPSRVEVQGIEPWAFRMQSEPIYH